MSGIPRKWFQTKRTGGSTSKEAKEQTVVVSGQANINFDHDGAQWLVICVIILLAVAVTLVLAVKYIRRIKRERNQLKKEIALLRASRGE